MNNMLDSKSIILENIDNIFNEYNRINEEKNVELVKIIQECNDLRGCNKKLITEVSEKDKLLIVNEKKMIDYEHMINKIQEDAMKEKTEKERFDMLKKQDKEIHDRDIEINRLQKKVEMLEEKLTMFNNNSDVADTVQEVQEEKPTEVVEEEETPIEVKKEEVNEEVVVVQEEEKPTEVVENPNDKIEGEDSGEETEELSDEEGEEVEIITHYKKEYYIIVNEKPQYIYTIEDGDLGEKVGEVQGKKKVFYNSSKN
jgi:myosin heavy subunit